METQTKHDTNPFNLKRFHISQQKTLQFPAISIQSPETPLTTEEVKAIKLPDEAPDTSQESVSKKKQLILRVVAVIAMIVIMGALYILWRPAPSTNTAPQSIVNLSSKINATANTDAMAGMNNSIQAYIVGAVYHPGVYTLASNARVYQLLQAAGGSRPEANLALLNLAAKLNDGQEIYVAHIGETPPATLNSVTSITDGTTSQGQLVNINSASADDLRLHLHLSSRSAQAIVDYRLQHGPFTSVNQLLQIVSKTIYTKIQGMVTVS